MAAETDVFASGYQGGAYREDVMDVIYQMTPEETPFYNMIGDAVATSVLHQWTTRSLAARAFNAQSEGDQYAVADFSNPNLPSRVSNYCQIVRKTPRVTGTQQAMEAVAIADLMADQLQIRGVEFKYDIEHSLLLQTMASGPTDSGDTTTRKMKGFWNAATATSMTVGALVLTESGFNAHLELGWSAGAKFSDVLVPSSLKRIISGFTGSSTKFIAAEDMRIVNSVNVYEGDFHVTTIHKCRDLTNTAGATTKAVFYFDSTFFAKAWLRRPFTEVLPTTGDDTKAVILAELTLEFGNSLASLNAHSWT